MIALFKMKAIVAHNRLSMIALFVMKVILANKICHVDQSQAFSDFFVCNESNSGQ